MKTASAEESFSAPEARLVEACLHALHNNLALRPGERVLVVSDRSTARIGNAFAAAARRITRSVEHCRIPVAPRHGEEPPPDTARAMAGADVVVMPLATSLSWTHARAAATQAGARVASMPAITEEIILRTFCVDYTAVRNRVNRVCDLLDAGNEVRVRSAAGTDLVLSISGRMAHGRKGGIYRWPGEWGNLPCGEAFIAPVEGSAEGVYVVDASMSGFGRVDMPVRLVLRHGQLVEIEGGKAAARLRSLLDAAGDKRAYNVAELGIGCNHGARLSGVTLEDEKVLGTCHIALGNNVFFGGRVDVAAHLDGVLHCPSIWIDGVKIMAEGRLEGAAADPF